MDFDTQRDVYHAPAKCPTCGEMHEVEIRGRDLARAANSQDETVALIKKAVTEAHERATK